jgi:hypothetical protein
MANRRVHFERLLGKRVIDPAGRCAGRIEEVRCRKDGGDVVVVEYLLGHGGLMKRLSISGAANFFTNLLGGYGNPASHKVPWDKMDLSDPERPRVTCLAEELDTIERQ